MTHGARVPALPPRALVLVAASGCAGIGYQIVWTQQFALALGHESAAVFAVVTAFFAGLGLGALAAGRAIERSARPAAWYAGCELAIGAWGLLLALLMPAPAQFLLQLTGPEPEPLRQWSVAFCGTLALLLPATAAMGATLPAMERVAARLARTRSHIGTLYASNTLGAVVGVLAIAFWLLPAYGLTRTALVCASVNALCAVLALRGLPADTDTDTDTDANTDERAVATRAGAAPAHAARAALARLAATGLLGIGYEVLVVRMLSQVCEDTVYTFALLLAVYLLGSAAGAAAYQRRWAQRADARRLGEHLFAALGASCVLGAGAAWAAGSIRDAVRTLAGPGIETALLAEALMALAAFAVPTFLMGALFAHQCATARRAGLGLGPCLGANTLGAAAAPPLFGVLLTPLLGAGPALLALAAAYLGLSGARAWRSPPPWLGAAALLALALALRARPLVAVDVPADGRIVSYQEGILGAVSVVADADGVLRLRINNRQQEGSSSSLFVDGRQALLPILLHPAPRTALFLGLGTGVTAASAALDRGLRVDAVELLPEVITASRTFTRALADDPQHAAQAPRLIAADARRYVRSAGLRYDVIVADNFHPARSGSAALYTVEHFAAVRERLASGGLFCQWLPVHQLDLRTLRSIVRSFLAAFPDGTALLASNSLQTPVLGLVGRRDAGVLALDAVRARLAGAEFARPAAEFGIDDEFSVLGSFVSGPQALRRFAQDAPVNTDDHPVVAYLAPRIAYADDPAPAARLVDLLHRLDVAPGELVAPGSTGERRLAAYRAARERFIELGQSVRPTPDARAMLARVQEPLLAVLRTSADFRPAYDPLVRMALALARTDRRAAGALLEQLRELQPARPEARTALALLAATPD